MGQGQKFNGSIHDVTVKISNGDQGEFFSSIEPLSLSATDTTLTLSYAHTAYAIPIVIPFTEALANAGGGQTINLSAFKKEEAGAEAVNDLGTAAYGLGAGDQPLGLGALIDNGDTVGTIGGQSRSIYSNLQATVTASGGTMTLSKLGILDDATSASGNNSETPNIYNTNKTVWNLYEQLIYPTVNHDYNVVGPGAISVRGNTIMNKASIPGGQGFTSLSFRGAPAIKDDAATAQTWFAINERYQHWIGRDVVPPEFTGKIRRVDLGTSKTMTGVANDVPSEYHGWYFQDYMMMPDQAGIVGRFYVIGQFITTQPRRSGRLTGITGI